MFYMVVGDWQATFTE